MTGNDKNREAIDAWLQENCGSGLPYKDATDQASMLHGLAYVLRQIEGTNSYKVHIGQCGPAASALRMALDHFAIDALNGQVHLDAKALPSHKASLHLTHNEHKSYYLSVQQAIDAADHGYTEGCWVSEDEKRKAIETNDCWTVQWYPETPVGFCILTAHSLDALLGAIKEPRP